ncbi:hypothetical protein B0T19DRAFT_134731 [Cercophora scortea]|uniref:Uncharacterized protein n=1 Tax=Cercophora scortea TaxID=314031 RepID=A0AAE0IYV3_9PEZI|nr:hypothetical protein B0T19DRAFT_134731 [Cercophora scortea]
MARNIVAPAKSRLPFSAALVATTVVFIKKVSTPASPLWEVRGRPLSAFRCDAYHLVGLPINIFPPPSPLLCICYIREREASRPKAIAHGEQDRGSVRPASKFRHRRRQVSKEMHRANSGVELGMDLVLALVSQIECEYRWGLVLATRSPTIMKPSRTDSAGSC